MKSPSVSHLTFTFLAIIASNCNSSDTPFTPGSFISISGKVSIATFSDANGHKEKQYLLVLQETINVSKDEFGGPIKNVDRIQIFPNTEKTFTKISSQLSTAYRSKRNIVAFGKLEYPISDHHHTKICLELDSVQLK